MAGITTMRCLMILLVLAVGRVDIVHADEIASLRAIVTDSKDPAVRREAVEKLKRLGRPAVPALRELLAHPEPTVRWRVLEALGNMSSPQRHPKRHSAWTAVPDMIRLLDDQDIRVRRVAAYNLGWFWSPPGEGPRRGEVAKAAVPKLACCLRDEDCELRKYSAELLWRIADVAWEAVPALIAALDDEDAAVRAFSRRTLLWLGPPERAYTARQLHTVLDAQPAAPDIPSGSRAGWAGWDNSETRADLGLSRMEALVYLGRKASDPEAKHAGSLLSELAADDHPAVRFHTLATRAKLGLAEESPAAILDAALTSDDSDVAFWAAHALVELHGTEAHKAVGILATAIHEHEPFYSRKGPTPEQVLADVKAHVAKETLQRLGVRIPTSPNKPRQAMGLDACEFRSR